MICLLIHTCVFLTSFLWTLVIKKSWVFEETVLDSFTKLPGGRRVQVIAVFVKFKWNPPEWKASLLLRAELWAESLLGLGAGISWVLLPGLIQSCPRKKCSSSCYPVKRLLACFISTICWLLCVETRLAGQNWGVFYFLSFTLWRFIFCAYPWYHCGPPERKPIY